MIKYKIFTKDNYFFIIDVETSREYSSHKADVLISKRYKDFDFYTAHNIPDWNILEALKIGELIKENDSPYTESEFETFYQQFTGESSGGSGGGSFDGQLTQSGSNVSASNPLPMIGTETDGGTPTGKALVIAGVTAGGVTQFLETNTSGHLNVADGGGSLTIDATSLPLPTGAATETTLAALNTKTPSLDAGKVPVKVDILQPLTNAELRAAPISTKITGAVIQEVPDLLASELASNFTSSVDGGDFINTSRSSNGQQFLEISIDPLSVGEAQTTVEFNRPVRFPLYAEIEASLSQKTYGDYAVMEITDKVSRDVEPTEYNIVSISQSTTTLTVTLDSPFDGWLGSWVDVYGLADSRFNYTNAAIATMSLDKKTLTITTRDEATIPSLTVTPNSTGGKLKRQAKLQNARNAVGIRFTGLSHTTAAFMSRFDSGSIKEAGTLTGARLATNGSTAPTYISGANGQVEIKPSSKYRIEVEPEIITFMDKSIDSATSVYSVRQAFTAVKPSSDIDYYIRFRAVSPRSISRPVAKIVSAVKATASTTATITTDVPHGLNVDSWVTIYGINNQTVFANLTAATKVASIVSATVFTIVIGTATIATSYGGYVSLCNGGVTQPGAIAQVVQSVAVDDNGFVTLIGTGTWAGLGGVGEYVNLLGIRNSTNGADLGVDGVYRVSNFATNKLVLEPVKNLNGTRAINGLGQNLSPTVGVIPTTNAGGAVLLRTTLRSHDFVAASYSQSVMNISGQGTVRADKAIPVIHAGSVGANQGTAASISGTTGLGGWYMHPAIVGLPDIASAALTSTTTSSAIANNLGNGFQVNIAVTAVTGTAPTLDVRIEESFDGGINWVTSYEMQRITANGSYNTPVLRAMGRHIRYVQTVGGTTPSFTRAVTRNVLPFIPAEPQKRIMDRSIVLTTLNSVTPTLFQAAANNVQLVINLGAATTPPALQLEGSEDGTNWYAMGTPLTGVANNTVQLTVTGLSATYTRARVSTAGAAVTAGYVSLKAWS